MKYVLFHSEIPIPAAIRIIAAGLCVMLMLRGSASGAARRTVWLNVSGGGQICNITDPAMTAHIDVMRDLPRLDTVATGGYEYDPYGTKRGIRFGIGTSAVVLPSWSVDADLLYSRKGETVTFISTAPATLTIESEYVEFNAQVRFEPPLPLMLRLSLFGGGYAGVPVRIYEYYRVKVVQDGYLHSIEQRTNLRPWMDGIDAGIIGGLGGTVGSGIRRVGVDGYLAWGLTDIRGSAFADNRLFPVSTQNVAVGFTLRLLLRMRGW